MPVEPAPWNDLDARNKAYVAVITEILADPDFGQQCLNSDDFARQAFKDLGNIDVPAGVKIVFVPEGDLHNSQNGNMGSVVIEIPPARTDPNAPEAMQYLRCTYPAWFLMQQRLK